MAKKDPLFVERNISALKLYADGMTRAEVAKELGIGESTVKDRLNVYRPSGVLVGSLNQGGEVKVDWKLLESLKGKGGEVPSVTKPVPSVAKRPAKPSKKNDLTDSEIAELRLFLEERKQSASGIKIKRSSEKPVRNFRIDNNLWAEVVARAERDNISLTAVVEESLKTYLNVEYA